MKLTQRNYFSKKANLEYLSVSQFKEFEKCEASALAEVKGKYKREKTTALLVGGYVDAYFDNSLPRFIKENPEIFKKDGTLKAEYIQAEAIIQRILKDRLFMDYLNGRKQVIMQGYICGVPVKIKIDSLHEDKIVDLKVIKDFDNVFITGKGSLPFFEAWGYDLQGAVYQEIVKQNTGKRLPFYIAAATKEKVTDLDIIHINQPTLDAALERFKQHAGRYDAIKKGIVPAYRCQKCEYCKLSKVLTEPTESDEYYLL